MEFAEIAGCGRPKLPDCAKTIAAQAGDGDKMSFLPQLRRYITERIGHFFPYVNDSKTRVHFLLPEKFSLDKCKDFAVKVLKISHPARCEKVSAVLASALTEGKLSGKVFSVLSEDGQKHVIAVLGRGKEAEKGGSLLAAVYDNVCTMFQVMQEKYLYPEYFDNVERQAWQWRDKGVAEEKISAMLKATNFNYEKICKITDFYGNVQAYAGAAAYLMIKAAQSENQEIADKTESFVLFSAAALSENLLEISGGGLNCSYQVVKNLIERIKEHGAAAYLDSQGWVDWKKLYDYTLFEVKNINYTPHAIMDARQKEGKFLQDLNRQYPDRRQMLNILQWCPEYKSSKILQDFTQAQLFYLNSRRL